MNLKEEQHRMPLINVSWLVIHLRLEMNFTLEFAGGCKRAA